ncbi:MAG: ATP-binding protein [Verrucomicrobiota bacterium]
MVLFRFSAPLYHLIWQFQPVRAHSFKESLFCWLAVFYSNILLAKPMATAEQIKALVKSHADTDDARFYAIAMQVAANEAKNGHADFAAELRALIDKAREKRALVTSGGAVLQFAAPRGELADLLTAYYPETRLSDMILAPELSVRLQRILDEQRHIGKLRGHNLKPRQKLLLTGPPGCGKTMTASALAGELGIPLLVVRLDGLITKFMGETTVKLRMIFDSVERTRAVYLFDEFDSIGLERGQGSDVGEIRRVLNSFLTFIELHTGTSLIIAATNHGHSLDAALFRRFDDLLDFQLPDRTAIRQTLQRRLALAPGKVAVDLGKATTAAFGMSFAEIVKACDETIKEMLLRDRADVNTAELLAAIRERHTFLKRGQP